jgi:hypothetical protein
VRQSHRSLDEVGNPEDQFSSIGVLQQLKAIRREGAMRCVQIEPTSLQVTVSRSPTIGQAFVVTLRQHYVSRDQYTNM